MKIGLVHYSAPPVLGGVERVIGEQASTLLSAGHEVTLFCSEGGREVHSANLIHVPRGATCLELTTALTPAFASQDAVLLHNVGTMPFYLEWTAALRAIARSLPSVDWICWVHDLAKGNPDYTQASCSGEADLLELPCSDWRYVAVSEKRALEVRERLGVPCSVVPNGFCPAVSLGLSTELARMAEDLGWWESDAILFYPCRIVRRKSIETGIEIVAALKEAGKRVHYLITGAADPHNPELEQIYRVADALLIPSRQEGFGLPFLEAAMCRLPAFCADIEPMRSLPGVSAWKAEWTPQQIASWLIRQIETRDTIQARKSVARTFRWKAVYRNFLAPLLQHPHSQSS
jgi:glycosyltransferase involved in cell wall biosynthesis